MKKMRYHSQMILTRIIAFQLIPQSYPTQMTITQVARATHTAVHFQQNCI